MAGPFNTYHGSLQELEAILRDVSSRTFLYPNQMTLSYASAMLESHWIADIFISRTTLTVTPIAFFAYARPAHTERALSALAKCERLSECRLLIYCDGPRSPDHLSAVEETRAVCRDWARKLGGELIIRDRNHGLARSIASTVDELTLLHGRVIVLEDDLVPSPEFLDFMLSALDKYEDEDRIVQISGSLLVGSLPSQYDAILLPLTTTWGWATWRRAWDLFKWEDSIDPDLLTSDAAFRNRFTFSGVADYVSMLTDRLNKKNDSWGILWWYAVAKVEGLVVYPRESLIWNGGFDGSGVHCDAAEEFRTEAPEVFRTRRLRSPLSLPAQIAIDQNAYEATRRYFGGPALSAVSNGNREKNFLFRLTEYAGRIIRRQTRY